MSQEPVDRQEGPDSGGVPGEGGESVVHSLPIYVFRKDTQGRVTFVNEAFCRMLERSVDQLVGKTDFDHYPEELAEKYRQDDQSVIETGRTLDTVEEHRLPDGSRLDVRVIKTPLVDAEGATVGVQGVFWDVSDRVQSEKALEGARAALERQIEQRTSDLAEANRSLAAEIEERKRVERELRDSEAKYHSLVRHLPMAVFRKDTEGRVTFVNEECARDLGTTPEEAIGKTDFDFFREKLATKYRADDEHVMKTDEVLRDVEEHDDADGHRRFVEVMKTAVHDHAGRVIGTQGLFWDVTERRKAEEASREGKQILQAIIDNTSAVIYLKDLEGRYLLINHQFEQLFGIQPDVARGKGDYDLFPKDAADAFRHNDKTVALTRKMLEIEEEVPQDGEVHTYWSTKFPLFDDDGEVFAVGGVSTDITDRKRDEEALKHKGAELERTNRTLQEEISRRGHVERDLRDSEALYHSLVEHVPLTIFRKDLEGRFTFANSALCKEFDAPLDQIIGRADADFSPPDLVEKYHRDDQHTIETGQVFRDVERFIDAEDNRR
ncbi:MAG: PAS domain-containing protein, partial [Phycisphaerae bacterium]|nr:PAS domain-containing protein [Phycisphaerae bacterium]